MEFIDWVKHVVLNFILTVISGGQSILPAFLAILLIKTDLPASTFVTYQHDENTYMYFRTF